MDLRKLILMLSSDNTGEVVAAAHAIDRLLKKHGKDWHWLADQVPQSVVSKVDLPKYRAPWNQPQESKMFPVSTLCKFLLRNVKFLTAKQVGFVNAMLNKTWDDMTAAQKRYLKGLVLIVDRKVQKEKAA